MGRHSQNNGPSRRWKHIVGRSRWGKMWDSPPLSCLTHHEAKKRTF